MSKKIHLLCNAHLDPVWLWEWQEGAAEAVSTFRVAADLCEQFDTFVFNHNEVILYEWVEEYEPELFARIQRLVQEGRWHIMGGWYLQPDCHMPSGESFVRQILVGRMYFKEKFGAEPNTAINFDPFGHNRGLVQILVKSGYDSYLFQRPFEGQLKLPESIVKWIGYDGSSVLAKRLGWGYNSPLGKATQKVQNVINEGGEGDYTLILWGVGNHGGGPSKQDLQNLTSFISSTTEYEIIHSTPEKYFFEMRDSRQDFPEFPHDLRPCMVGCYTSQALIKQRHRMLENELFSAEKMLSSAVINSLMDYPEKDLRAAQRDLLMSQFHDILPGTSIQPAERASLRLIDHALETISRLKTKAFFALASGLPPAKENHIPILVYNPHPHRLKTIVECEFQLADQNWDPDFTTTPVFDIHGNPLPYQNEKEECNLNLDWRKRVAFLAELEPSSMNRFDCIPQRIPEKPKPLLESKNGKIHFKNDEMELVINCTTGLIDSYCIGGVEMLKQEAFKPIVIKDNEDPWGMTVNSFRETIGEFSLMDSAKGTEFSGVMSVDIPSVRVIEDGEVRSVIECVFEYMNSAICQHYILPKSGTAFEVKSRVFWNEKNKMLKLEIPLSGSGFQCFGQGAYGYDELPNDGSEAVSQKWVGISRSDSDFAFTCINDGIYGSDFTEENGLRLSLLRSPAYSGHPIHDRPIVPQDRFLPRIDQGERLYHFRFNAGLKKERFTNIDREALVFNETPMALSFFPTGAGVKNLPSVIVDGGTVEMTAFKRSEDGSGWIVRLFEPTGKEQTASLEMPIFGVKTEFRLSQFEIKTIYINASTASVSEVDLMERPI